MKNETNNKLIADFMGIVFHDDANQYYSAEGLYIGTNLQYHTSWDWLMPVVCKIDDHFGDMTSNIRILTDDDINDQINKVHNAVLNFDIEIAHWAVVEFITNK